MAATCTGVHSVSKLVRSSRLCPRICTGSQPRLLGNSLLLKCRLAKSSLQVMVCSKSPKDSTDPLVSLWLADFHTF